MENVTLKTLTSSTCSMYSDLLQDFQLVQTLRITYFIIAVNIVLIISAISIEDVVSLPNIE